jgi:hypothetical protein
MEGEVSFRIQVALRTVLVADENVLREFIEGKVDGKEQQSQVDKMLRGILKDKIDACEVALTVKWANCIESRLAQNLWEAELEIARVAYEKLIEP